MTQQQEGAIEKKGSPVALFAVVVISCAVGCIAQTACNNLLTLCADTYGISSGTAQWLTTIFPLVLGIVIPVGAYLLKRFKLRPLIIVSLIIFIVGAACSWLAPNYALMLVGRVLQAVSCGIFLPMIQVTAVDAFPPQKIGLALGISSGVALGFAPCFGPLMSGLIASAIPWQMFFMILGAIAVIMLIVAIFAAYNVTTTDANEQIDILSVILSAFAFGGLLLGISQASNTGFGDPVTYVSLIVGVIALILFIIRQRGERHLISLDIFKNRRFVIGVILVALTYACCLSAIIIVSIDITAVAGGQALQVGLICLPAAICNIIVGFVAGAAVDKFGMRPVTIVGAIVMLIGAAMAIPVTADTALWYLAVSFALRFAGMTALLPSLIGFALSKLPREIIPDGVSANNAAQQLAGAFGMTLAILVISAVGFDINGIRAAFIMATIFALAALIIIIPCFKEK